MSGSNRYGHITLALIGAAFFVLTLTILIATVSWQYTSWRKTYFQYQQAAEQDRRNAANEITRACEGMESVAFANCISDRVETYYRQQAVNEDLQAQQDMAFWGKWMFYASAGSVALTAFGIWLIYLNLREARKVTVAAIQGTKAAEESVKEAREATNAAKDSGAVTEDTAERQLRAYICIKQIQWRSTGSFVKTDIEIQNFGQTPAYELEVQSNIDICDFAQTVGFPGWADKPTVSKSILGPGANTRQYDEFRPLTTGEFDALTNGDLALYAYGEVRYKDVFGEDRFTKFRFMVGGNVGFVGDYMCACPEGNEAN